MVEERLHTCVYHILRYTPNLIRDEWINIGVLLHDPAQPRLRLRLIEEEDELARLRRLHPHADLAVLSALQAELEARLAEHREDVAGYIARLDETLSNVLQLSPQKAVLTEDFDAEFDRLYHDHVTPPRAGVAPDTRIAIRKRINGVFKSAGILSRLEHRFRVDEFTYRGDPMRLDYAYRRNGTRGFVHALALARDPGQAKVLAFTAERIRAKLDGTEFTAVTETEPRPEDARHQFVTGLLAEQQIQVVPVSLLAEFANRLRPDLR
jgi:hypothetical protein